MEDNSPTHSPNHQATNTVQDVGQNVGQDMGQNSGQDMGAQESASAATSAADTQLRAILCDVLGLDPDQVKDFDADTGLFGHLPELDSMAVAGLLTEIEDRLDILIEDDDVDGEMLETFGGLLSFTEAKVAGA